MQIGYARISTDEQREDLQLDALKAAGCERVFSDVISGSRDERRGLHDALEYVRGGDMLVVWRLDRLSRSLKSLIELMNELAAKGVGFHSLTEHIDTTNPSGKLVFHVFGALAEFERDLTRQRTKAGLAAARARGHSGGRPKAAALNTPHKVAMAQALFDDKRNSIRDICQTLGVSKATLYRYLNATG